MDLRRVKSYKQNETIQKSLDEYPIPECLSELYSNNKFENLEEMYPVLLEPLSATNYRHKFHTLLYVMEIENDLSVQRFNTEGVFLTENDEFLCLEIKALSEFPNILTPMDTVKVYGHTFDTKPFYEGRILKIDGIKLFIKFHNIFHKLYQGKRLKIEFFKSSTYKYLHNALDQALKKIPLNILFPVELNLVKDNKPFLSTCYNSDINLRQKTAISNFTQNKYNLPLIIVGSPGTGKTATLIEAIMQTYIANSDSRIIVLTYSNNAAENILRLLLNYQSICEKDVIRLISFAATNSDNFSEDLKQYCAVINSAFQANDQYNMIDDITKKEIQFLNPNKIVDGFRIIVSTIGNVCKFMRFEIPNGSWCTHMFIDEASQMIEPEIIMALTLIKENYGRVLLAGDLKYPVKMFRRARKYGVNESFLERMLSAELHQKNDFMITKLQHNYRFLPKVIEIPNKLFYENSLTANLDPKDAKIKSDLNILIQSMKDYNKSYNFQTFPGVCFLSIQGINYKGKYDPQSWLNPKEGNMVYNYTSNLYKHGFTSDDIGIITPYTAQVGFIKHIFKKNQESIPKIGTFEEFYGSEKKLIIISTVLAGKIDNIKLVDFVSCSTKLNVALTRAKFITIIIGDSNVLSKNKMWSTIIGIIRNNDGFIRVNLPHNTKKSLNDSTNKSAVNNLPRNSKTRINTQTIFGTSSNHTATSVNPTATTVNRLPANTMRSVNGTSSIGATGLSPGPSPNHPTRIPHRQTPPAPLHLRQPPGTSTFNTMVSINTNRPTATSAKPLPNNTVRSAVNDVEAGRLVNVGHHLSSATQNENKSKLSRCFSCCICS